MKVNWIRLASVIARQIPAVLGDVQDAMDEHSDEGSKISKDEAERIARRAGERIIRVIARQLVSR